MLGPPTQFCSLKINWASRWESSANHEVPGTPVYKSGGQMWAHNVNQFEFRARDIYGIGYKMFYRAPPSLPVAAWYRMPNTEGANGLRLIQNDADVLTMFECMRAAQYRRLEVYFLSRSSALAPNLTDGGYYTLPPDVPSPAFSFSVRRLYDEYENSLCDIHPIRSKERGVQECSGALWYLSYDLIPRCPNGSR